MNTTKAIPEKKKRAARIRYEMNLLGMRGSDIARLIKVNRVTVNREIQGAHRSRMVREAVAKALDKSYREVWGEE